MSQHTSEEENWDLVIQPRNSLLDLRLADVWRYRDLLGILVRRDFVSQYKQTILGPIWFVLQPLMTSFAFLVIFGRIAKISTGTTIPQPLFYLSGVILWTYFAECLNKTSTVFRDNASIFGKVYFPRLIMPLSIVSSNLMRFAVQLALFVLMLVYYIVFEDYQLQITPYLLLLPLMVILMAILALSMGMIISALTTKYRDLAFLVAFGVQLLMYATPIIYPLSTLPQKAQDILKLNPMAPIVEGFRKGIFNEGYFSLGYLGYSVAVSVGLLFVAIVIFNRVEKSFIDTV
jgi:lipopolysaccharide transport system permease protein